MDSVQIPPSIKLLSDWFKIFDNQTGQNVDNFNSLFISFYKELRERNNTLVENWTATVDEFPKVMQQLKMENQLYGSGFNVLKFFDIGETKHSFLLVNLLNPHSEHGQGNLFLKVFLELIGIDNPEDGQWNVTAETGRIDILLKRAHPHSVIIIENKSNWAADQPQQLYRYWYEQIFLELPNLPFDYAEKNKSRYRMIYLPPNDLKIPVANSLERPPYLQPPLPDILPMEIELRTFNVFVVNWLEECLSLIPGTNYRLKEYILQYIELWKN